MDLLRLTRPVDFPLFVAAVLLGGWLQAGDASVLLPAAGRLVLAALAGALVGLGANVINDVYDVEIDRRNAPHRPLAAGRVTRRAALTLWLLLSTSGVVLGFLASGRHGAVAAAAVVLLWAYAARLKRLPGLGHVVVGATLGAAVVYGALAVRDGVSAPVQAGALIAAWLVATREVVKAIPDIAGDRELGAATLPAVVGARPAAAAATVAIALSITALPLVMGAGFDTMTLAYLLPMAGLLLAAAWALISADAVGGGARRWGASATRASGLMKAALEAGVVALALGR